MSVYPAWSYKVNSISLIFKESIKTKQLDKLTNGRTAVSSCSDFISQNMEAHADWSVNNMSLVYRQKQKKTQQDVNSLFICIMLLCFRSRELLSIWKLATATHLSKPSTNHIEPVKRMLCRSHSLTNYVC